jgi:sarcosine oxidase
VRKTGVVIIGAGAMGCSAAHALASRGRDVVVLDQFGPENDRGSSHGSVRIFRLTHADPLYVDLTLKALDRWRTLEDETGTELLTTTGGIDHGNTQALGAVEEVLRAARVTHSRLSPQEASERWPGFVFEGPVLYQPDGGRIHAHRTLGVLRARAAQLGAEFRFMEPVSKIQLNADGQSGVVHTESDSFEAEQIVVTAGPWTEKMVGGLVKLPVLRVTREQPAHFTPRDADTEWPSFVHRFATPTMSEVNGGIYGLFSPGEGLKVGERGGGPLTDPDEVGEARLARLAGYVARMVPGVRPEPSDATTCMYTMTPAEDFLFDRSGPLIVCSICSGHGFKFVPLAGEMIADLAEGKSLSEPRFRFLGKGTPA